MDNKDAHPGGNPMGKKVNVGLNKTNNGGHEQPGARNGGRGDHGHWV